MTRTRTDRRLRTVALVACVGVFGGILLRHAPLLAWTEPAATEAKPTAGTHWAFRHPTRPALPDLSRSRHRDWPRQPLDTFVLRAVERAGLSPSPEADPARLLRRVSLDLTGLPPSDESLERFLAAAAGNLDWAYEAEVDRLLQSPACGERLALDWLDAARFADTNGYFGDRPRQAWPWRDWVIQAFQRNLPFDQFTIEQLAGDLLPTPTREQRIATGFHRNAMANNETGIIDEEYRVEMVADRVETTATVWLGLTFGCAQCHDHKHDPITQRDYYGLFAFFNNSVETGLVTKDDPPPTIDVPTAEQAAALAAAQSRAARAEQSYAEGAATLATEIAAWEADAAARLARPPSDAIESFDFAPSPDDPRTVGTGLPRESGVAGDAGRFDATQHVELPSDWNPDQPWTVSIWAKPSGSLGCLWSKIEPTEARRGVELIWQKGRLQLNLVHRWGDDEITLVTRSPVSANAWHHVLATYDGSGRAAGVRLAIDDHDAAVTVIRDALTGTTRCDQPLRIGRRDTGLGFYGSLDEFQRFARAVPRDECDIWADRQRVLGALARSSADRSASDGELLRDYYLRQLAAPAVRAAYDEQRAARAAVAAARAAIPTTLVMQERAERRVTHLLERGQYDAPAEEVPPSVPDFLPPLSPTVSRDRLALARWLVAPEHPLTARVTVNRFWQLCFGEGLVRTPGDFGLQGEPPTHPEVLDSLAVEFVESGWDVKRLLRRIVTSATYRQSSQATPESLRLDPDNRLWSRGPRFRLPAELLRDQALAASGLLVRRIGGPSVKPYQPDGLWEDVSYNAEDSYVPDPGEGQWRRSLYSYWKRQAPPPALLIFDANTREKCVVRRSRTNTPLQALVTLNDPTYWQAARELAQAALACDRATGETLDQARLRFLFQRVLSRVPTPRESATLLQFVARRRAARSADDRLADEQLADEQLAEEQFGADASPELAAWTLLAHTILNLDEAITRR